MKIFNKLFNNKKKKTLRTLKYITIFLVCLLVVEGIYFGIRIVNIRKNSTYYSTINSIIKKDDSYIAVGLSDSKYSKNIKYKKPGYNKPYIWIYNNNLKIVDEYNIAFGYNGEFKDIIEVSDGYIVIGSLEMSESNHKEISTEAVIVKYDEKFNVIWRKNYNPLGNTKFNSVKELEDGSLLVAGSSVYESSVIGNHTNGGAIIVKYSSDGDVLLEQNTGGPKTGCYNDIELLKDGFIVVGYNTSGTGLIMKYDYNFKEVWHNYYGYTDSDGLTSITKISDTDYVVTGTKLDGKDETDNYKASLIRINNKGKIVDIVNYQKESITKFMDSVLIDDKLYVISLYGKKSNKLLDNDSLVITYDLDLKELDSKEYVGDNTLSLNKIINNSNKYLAVGHTNSKLKINNIKTNGLDYYPVIIE